MNVPNDAVRKMKRSLSLFAICAVLLSNTGCQEKLGGGSSSIASGTTSKTYVYGIRSGKRLGFVIFSDIAGEASAGSSWTGYIKPKEGAVVEYKGDSDGIVINGTEHKFAKGRVFLAETTGGVVTVEQLDTEIGDAHYNAELDSLRKHDDIQAFLNK